jgi:hypothetical protein
MMQNIMLGALLLLITCGLHLGAMVLVIHLLGLEGGPLRKSFRRLRAFPVAEVVLVMATISMLEVLLWAFAYMALGEIKELEAAFYFSMATFTTLGYGDIVLDQSWRLLASFQAATGIIMFGWTTAILMTVVQHSYFGRKLDNQGP